MALRNLHIYILYLFYQLQNRLIGFSNGMWLFTADRQQCCEYFAFIFRQFALRLIFFALPIYGKWRTICSCIIIHTKCLCLGVCVSATIIIIKKIHFVVIAMLFRVMSLQFQWCMIMISVWMNGEENLKIQRFHFDFEWFHLEPKHHSAFTSTDSHEHHDAP